MSDSGFGTPVIDFDAPGAWSEEYFALSLDFPRPNGTALARAAEALWTSPDLEGCWLQPDANHERAPRVTPRSALEASTDAPPNLYGLARLPDGVVVPCLNNAGLGRDYMFVQLAINARALRAIRRIDWGEYGPRLAQWLVDAAELVHASTPIETGVIGWELSGSDYEDSPSGQEPTRGYLRPRGAKLVFTPPTLFFAR